MHFRSLAKRGGVVHVVYKALFDLAMEIIHIPQLARALNGTETFELDEFLPELTTLTPIRGWLRVAHRGTFLEVKAQAWTIMTLTCDRTLRQFNHRLEVDTEELIWLAEQPSVSKFGVEEELSMDDLVESVLADGDFDPNGWLYEQLMLAIPFPTIAPDAPDFPDLVEAIGEGKNAAATPEVDRRWAALAALQLPDEE